MAYDFDTPVRRLGTDSVKWDGLTNRFGQKNLISMWVADMDFVSPPAVVEALQQRVAHGVYGYTRRPEDYFGALARWQNTRHNWEVDPQWVAHAPGVVASLNLLIQTFTGPGDKVMIQPPVYYPFYEVISRNKRRVVENPLAFDGTRYTMDFEDAAKKLADGVKMVILCSPHNPVGRVWTREELTRFGELCLSYGVLVVSDEIHGDLIYSQYTHTPFAAITEDFANHCVTCVSPSKTFNLAGFHSSAVVLQNSNLRQRYLATLGQLALDFTQPLTAVAFMAAYQQGGPWLDELLQYLQDNLAFVEKFMLERVPSVRVIHPEGTYLVWLDFRQLGLSSKELDHFIIDKAGLALDEGHIFGAAGEGFQRLNIACPRLVLQQAMMQLDLAVESRRLK
ncbi:pyridoxal phosphate-dependent aminotransferase [Alicyclobacillaceae bacterium I2511]|nr:pyridoxal phosphate-dependent aminotransferase [Alicyclobacillaceae bacterium I2511]